MYNCSRRRRGSLDVCAMTHCWWATPRSRDRFLATRRPYDQGQKCGTFLRDRSKTIKRSSNKANDRSQRIARSSMIAAPMLQEEKYRRVGRISSRYAGFTIWCAMADHVSRARLRIWTDDLGSLTKFEKLDRSESCRLFDLIAFGLIKWNSRGNMNYKIL